MISNLIVPKVRENSKYGNTVFPYWQLPPHTVGKHASSRKLHLPLTHYRPAMPFGNRKKIKLEGLFSSVLSQFKKYHPSVNLEFINLDIFQGLKFRILMERILSIFLELNFTPNTLGCYGLMCTSKDFEWNRNFVSSGL